MVAVEGKSRKVTGKIRGDESKTSLSLLRISNSLLYVYLFIEESLIRETVLNHSLILKFLENLGKFKKD